MTVNISDPTLAIGSVSNASVINVAFTYRISDYSYSKAADETALSGEDVPQSKYGAWRLEIDSDGTISVVEADGNGTGYDTAAQAVRGLGAESGTNCCMGFVTAVNTSGVFDPGMTALDDGDVTATYTEGYHSTRGVSHTALISRHRLWLGPKPDDIFRFRATGVIRPDVMTSGTSPLDKSWGIVIAYGAAVMWAARKSNAERRDELAQEKNHYMKIIKRPDLIESGAKRAAPRW